MVLGNNPPQRIIDNAIDVGFPNTRAPQCGEAATNDFSITESVGIGHHAHGQIPRPGQPVALHPVDQKIVHAQMQGVGTAHPDTGQERIGTGERTLVCHRIKYRITLNIIVILNISEYISECQRGF